VPTLVDAGRGWLLLRAVEVVEPDVASWRDEALSDRARLHDTFADRPALADGRLREVTGRELPTLREQAFGLASEHDLPQPLRVLAADPETLLVGLGGQTTLVHGDPWSGNVLPTPGGGRCWIDWEEAGAGPPRAELARVAYGRPRSPTLELSRRRGWCRRPVLPGGARDDEWVQSQTFEIARRGHRGELIYDDV
jgi:aminoglycoside phosphotransferase (APT) family kinase protein